jgi:hypothetical protein
MTAIEAEKINRFNPTAEEVQLGSELLATQTGQAFSYFLDLSATAFNAKAVTIFTAPFPMRIIRLNALAMASVSGATVTFDKGTDAIATLACAADGTLTSGGAAVEAKAGMVLAAGDTVTVQSSAAGVLGIMSVDCVRL